MRGFGWGDLVSAMIAVFIIYFLAKTTLGLFKVNKWRRTYSATTSLMVYGIYLLRKNYGADIKGFTMKITDIISLKILVICIIVIIILSKLTPNKKKT